MEVALYIKTPKYQDLSEFTALSFKDRVIADGGVFEAENCLISNIESLGGVFGEFESFNRIELYDDEKISVTSSVQNINDISKVFTDYSQSFTIPASENNNQIFRHWYENEVEGGFDQRVRYDGYIKIDTRTFRIGKWQIESADIKSNRVENYKITFYGDLLSLTDAFGKDKLTDLNTLNDYTINYSGERVRDLITDANGQDVMFPLISSSRVWQYGSGGENIATSAHAIDYTELYPAVRVKSIFNAIENRYGVTFNGSFLTNPKFTEAYLWLKSKEAEQFNPLSEKSDINFTSNHSANFFNLNGTTDTLSFFELPANGYFADPKFELVVAFASTVNYVLNVYKNGAFYTSVTGTGAGTGYLVDENDGLGDYSFDVQTNITTTYTFSYNAEVYEYDPVGVSGYVNLFVGSGNGSIALNLDLTATAPDMKVADFFSGILKMFNLTAFSTNGIDFTIEQIEEWYYKGQIKDFSQYTISDFDFQRIKPYKKISLSYQKSESLTNTEFYNNNNRYYGDLEYAFPYDGSEYSIKLPFEDIMFSKFSGTELQVAYCLKTDLKPYVPKPVILYRLKNQNTSFYFDKGVGSAELLTSYNVFGQDVAYLNAANSLNWGSEISTFFLGNPINKSLFNNYYLTYLDNLFKLKSRMLKVKMRLPYNEILDLKLNDRVLIRNKRYVINQYTTDLTTFETSFELIQDFRAINFRNNQLVSVIGESNEIKIFTVSNRVLTWAIDSDTDAMINNVTNQDDGVILEINTNSSGRSKSATIINEDGQIIIIEQYA
jgi:hypothetical protein